MSLFLTATLIACMPAPLFAQEEGASNGCAGAYAGKALPNSRAALLVLQRQCELAITRDNRPHMEYELAKSKLALLRLHVALGSITAEDRRLPNSIGTLYAGDAAAILASTYEGKSPAQYEAAIIDAAWLAAKSQVPQEDARAAIRSAINIYVARQDYVSAGKLIQHIEEPVLAIPSHIANAQLLIDLLQSPHVNALREPIATLLSKWGSRHVAILGPIDYVEAEAYKSDDPKNYLNWLNVAEGNDFPTASTELNSITFATTPQVIAALHSLGYDKGIWPADTDVNQAALIQDVAAFGAAALGSGLDDAYYTTQNGDLLTKLRILSGQLLRVSPTRGQGVGRVNRMIDQGTIEATGFLAYDACTVVTALHALGGKPADSNSLFFNLPLPGGDVRRSRIRVVAMGNASGIPTSPVDDWLIGKLEPCAPQEIKAPGLAENDRSFDATDNTFAFELSHEPVTYFAAGFPGGGDESLLTVSPCNLSQRLGLTLAFDNTCYLHGMSGGPVYAHNPDGAQNLEVVALNTLLGKTLDESIMSNGSITSNQRGEGTLAIVFAPAAWRASHFHTVSDAQLSLVNDQVKKLTGNDSRFRSASQRISFVIDYVGSHVPLELRPFWYYFGDLDTTNADAFLQLTGAQTAATDWLPGLWCGDHQKLTISKEGPGRWAVENFEKKREYGDPVAFGENIIFKNSQSVVGEIDFIFRRRSSDLDLVGTWEVTGPTDGRARNWVYTRSNKLCPDEPHDS